MNEMNRKLPNNYLPAGHELHDTSEDSCAAHDDGGANCWITRCDTCEENQTWKADTAELVHHHKDPDTGKQINVDMTKNYDPHHSMFKHLEDGTDNKFNQIIQDHEVSNPNIGQQFADIMKFNKLK
jgi:hypothetical protein